MICRNCYFHDQGVTCYRTSSIPTKPKSRPGLLPATTGNSQGSHDSTVSFLMEVKYTVFRVSPSHRRAWHVLHKPSFKCWSLIQLACTGQAINKLRQVKPMSAALQQDSGSWPMTCLEEQLLSVVPRSLAEPLWGAVWECSGTEGKAAVIFFWDKVLLNTRVPSLGKTHTYHLEIPCVLSRERSQPELKESCLLTVHIPS